MGVFLEVKCVLSCLSVRMCNVGFVFLEDIVCVDSVLNVTFTLNIAISMRTLDLRRVLRFGFHAEGAFELYLT